MCTLFINWIECAVRTLPTILMVFRQHVSLVTTSGWTKIATDKYRTEINCLIFRSVLRICVTSPNRRLCNEHMSASACKHTLSPIPQFIYIAIRLIWRLIALSPLRSNIYTIHTRIEFRMSVERMAASHMISEFSIYFMYCLCARRCRR